MSRRSPRHLIALVLGYVPFPSACLGSCLSYASPRHRYRCLCCCRPIAFRYPPRLIDTTGGETRLGCGGSLGSACLSPPRLAISSVRFGIGWRRGTVLASLYCPAYLYPMTIIGAACYPLARSIRFPRRPAVLPPHRLPPRSLDTGDGAVPLAIDCLPVRLGRYCRSISPAVDLRGFCECGNEGCLACLGVVLCMLSMG